MFAELGKRFAAPVFAAVLATAAPAALAQAQTAEVEAAIALIEAEEFPAAYAALLPLAEAGDPLAQFHLGNLYLAGDGVARDDAQAVHWHLLAAEAGLAEAQNAMALHYFRGVGGLLRDDAQGMIWLTMAADQGYPPALVAIGIRYVNGQGVEQDFARALMLFRAAADQGLPEAAYQVGLRYALGQGVEQDYAEAVAWMQVAADGGFAVAHFQLGAAYERGQGAAFDIRLAFFHFAVAYLLSGQGPEGPFFAAVDDVAQMMTEAERQEGIAAAEAWVEAFNAAAAE